MVEPISLALISGAAGLGAIIGRVTKQRHGEIREISSFSNQQQIPKLEFIAVKGLVKPDEIIDLALQKKQVFVNVKKLLISPDKLFKFLHQLQFELEKVDLKLHQISKELMLISTPDQIVQVKTLQKLIDSDLDTALPAKSIAGY